jgi:hypothetical protein
LKLQSPERLRHKPAGDSDLSERLEWPSAVLKPSLDVAAAMPLASSPVASGKAHQADCVDVAGNQHDVAFCYRPYNTVVLITVLVRIFSSGLILPM